jgi:hypothetical protein
MKTYGPMELRIKWMMDETPYDYGDAEDQGETDHYIDLYGVMGCVLETRPPACACCGLKDWTHATSLWSIVGDDDYHRTIERELMAEV